MPEKLLPRLLCVDDEPRVVKGLALHLRGDFEVLTAHSGVEALDQLKSAGVVAVVISDMRMPGMDGAVLLSRIRESYPDTTRILLTGESSRDAVISAVNSGQIFRILTKPCAPKDLMTCAEAALGQHRLMTAERVLLQQTLVGFIDALVDVLALTNPVAFGRASRIRRQAMAFAAHLGIAQGYWQLEAAAMLSQIGYLAMPPELFEKVYYGESLNPEEQLLIQTVPDIASKLLDHIPRLEPVVQILQALSYSVEQLTRLGDGTIGLGARILRLIIDYDSLISQKYPNDTAVQMLSLHADRYNAGLLQKFSTHLGTTNTEVQVIQIALRLVRPEMTILQDVRSDSGALLVTRGFEVTDRFVERIKNFGPTMLSMKIEVSVPTSRLAGTDNLAAAAGL